MLDQGQIQDWYIISDQDKQFVRDHILELLVQIYKESQLNMRFYQILDSVTTIASVDFPDRWPEFCEKIWMKLSTEESDEIIVASTCCKEIFKYFLKKFGGDGMTQISSLQTYQNPLPKIWEKVHLRITELMLLLAHNPSEESFKIRLNCATVLLTNISMENIKDLLQIFKDILLPSDEEDCNQSTQEETQKGVVSPLSDKLRVKSLKFFLKIFENFGSIDQCEYNEFELFKEINSAYIEPVIDFCANLIKSGKDNF